MSAYKFLKSIRLLALPILQFMRPREDDFHSYYFPETIPTKVSKDQIVKLNEPLTYLLSSS